MTWQDSKSKMDEIVGTLAGLLLSLNIILGSGALLFESVGWYPIWQQGLCGLFFVWCIVTEGWFLWMTFRVLAAKERPVPIAIAMRQPRVLAFIRPLLSLWWSFHFLMGVGWGIMLAVHLADMPLYVSIIVAAVTSGLAYITFGYFLLAVTTLTKKHELIARVWRWRTRWALAHGLLVLGATVTIAPYVKI